MVPPACRRHSCPYLPWVIARSTPRPAPACLPPSPGHGRSAMRSGFLKAAEAQSRSPTAVWQVHLCYRRGERHGRCGDPRARCCCPALGSPRPVLKLAVVSDRGAIVQRSFDVELPEEHHGPRGEGASLPYRIPGLDLAGLAPGVPLPGSDCRASGAVFDLWEHLDESTRGHLARVGTLAGGLARHIRLNSKGQAG